MLMIRINTKVIIYKSDSYNFIIHNIHKALEVIHSWVGDNRRLINDTLSELSDTIHLDFCTAVLGMSQKETKSSTSRAKSVL